MSTPIRTMVAGVAMVDELDPVLPSAVRLADDAGARLYVLHVLALPDLALTSAAPELQGLTADALRVTDRSAAVAAALRAQCARFARAPERLAIHALTGSAHHQLTAFARRLAADLLVIGASRDGPVWRSPLGTTAERVLRESTVPVLVLHQPFFRPVRRVLLTTDLSGLSVGIHERGLDVVEGMFGGEELACRSLVALGFRPTPPVGGSVEELARREVERFLAERRRRSYPLEARVRWGEPANEINLEADAWHADLIVLGTHGCADMGRGVFGSVAAAALRDATRNVLVVPPAPPVPLADEPCIIN